MDLEEGRGERERGANLAKIATEGEQQSFLKISYFHEKNIQGISSVCWHLLRLENGDFSSKKSNFYETYSSLLSPTSISKLNSFPPLQKGGEGRPPAQL